MDFVRQQAAEQPGATAAGEGGRLATDPPAVIDVSAPDFLTALQEQLGLKLEKAKVPVEVLVIDRVDRVPTRN